MLQTKVVKCIELPIGQTWQGQGGLTPVTVSPKAMSPWRQESWLQAHIPEPCFWEMKTLIYLGS